MVVFFVVGFRSGSGFGFSETSTIVGATPTATPQTKNRQLIANANGVTIPIISLAMHSLAAIAATTIARHKMMALFSNNNISVCGYYLS